MTRWASILGLIAVISAMCCVSKDQPSVHLVTAYQLRGAVQGSLDAHSIDALDGLGGYTINCELGSQTIFFSLSAEYEYKGVKRSIAVDSHAPVNKSEGSSHCVLTIKEDNNYQSDCVATQAKTVDCSKDKVGDPCRVAVQVDGDTINGVMCCRYLPIKGKQPKDTDRALWKPSTTSKPAEFKAYNCR